MNTHRKFLRFSVPVGLLLGMGVLVGAHAAHAAPVATPSPQTATTQGAVIDSVVVADVNVSDAVTLQKGNAVTIDFNILNGVGVQPQIRYGIQLLQSTTTRSVVDEYVYDDTVSLSVNSKVHKTITYTAPQFLATGDYELFLVAKNNEGLPLAFNDIGTFHFTNQSSGTTFFINPDSCYLTVVGEKSAAQYNPLQGVDIAPTENLKMHCSVKPSNSLTAPVSVTPLYVTKWRSSYGKVVPQEGGDTTATITSVNTLDLTLPKAQQPQAYDASVTLQQNGKTISNTVTFHYIVRGIGASIGNVTLDKDQYAKGDTANIAMFVSPSADVGGVRIVGIASTSLTASISMTDGTGSACMTPFTRSLEQNDLGVYKIPVSITAHCVNPKVQVSILDVNGNKLDANIFAVTSVIPPTPILSMVLAILVGVIVLAVIWFVYTKRKPAMVVPLLFLLVALFAPGVARASTVVYTPSVGDHKGVSYVVTTNLDKSTYAPGAQINVTVAASYTACYNTITGLAISMNPDTPVDLPITYGVASSTWSITNAGHPTANGYAYAASGSSNASVFPYTTHIFAPMALGAHKVLYIERFFYNTSIVGDGAIIANSNLSPIACAEESPIGSAESTPFGGTEGPPCLYTASDSFTVTTPTPAPTCKLSSANPSPGKDPASQWIDLGGQATLNYTITGKADSAYFTYGANNTQLSVSTSTGSTGSHTFSPTAASTRYKLTVKNSVGSYTCGPASILINVPACTLTPASQTISSGDSATLNYTITGNPPSASINGTAVTVSAQGSHAFSPTVNTSYTMTVSDVAGTNHCGPVSVTATQKPDLTITGPITPTTGTVNTVMTLSATVQNIGIANAGAFYNLFEISTDGSSHSNPTPYSGSSIVSIAKAGSAPTTYPWRPAAAGTYYVRACADHDASMLTASPDSGDNVIDELLETNNCSPWTTVTIKAPDLPVVTPTCANTPTMNGCSCTAKNNCGTSTSGSYTNGQCKVPTATCPATCVPSSTYTCNTSGNRVDSCGTVSACQYGCTKGTCNAAPQVPNALSCTLSESKLDVSPTTPDKGADLVYNIIGNTPNTLATIFKTDTTTNVTDSGTAVPTTRKDYMFYPTADATFTMKVTNDKGATYTTCTGSPTVLVAAQSSDPSCTVTAPTAPIQSGTVTALTYTLSTNTTKASISDGTNSTSLQVPQLMTYPPFSTQNLTKDTVYTLTVTNSATVSKTCTATVKVACTATNSCGMTAQGTMTANGCDAVQPDPKGCPSCVFSPSSGSVTSGSTVNLNYTVTNTAGATISNNSNNTTQVISSSDLSKGTGIVSEAPTQNTTYTMNVSNTAGGVGSCPFKATIIGSTTPTIILTPEVDPSNTVVVDWTVNNVIPNACTITINGVTTPLNNAATDNGKHSIPSVTTDTTVTVACPNPNPGPEPIPPTPVIIIIKPNPPAISLTPATQRVQQGTTATLSWSVTRAKASSCSITPGGVGAVSKTLSNVTDDSGSYTTAAIQAETPFTLSCTGLDGSNTSARAIVQLVPGYQER